tara:strand:+ start:576 stop:830 length:255 start_codon:yes stop_codon:yes gene_type:complete
MLQNKEDLKNKIIYRASYRGSKEMDILMTNFVKSVINDLEYEQLIDLNYLVNMDDESLISLKSKNSEINLKYLELVERFQKFKI